MALETFCANLACRRRFLFPESAKGKSVTCPTCKETFVAGTVSTAGDAGPAAATKTATAAKTAADTIGSTFGRFIVRQKLGAGMFGTVYRAFDPILDRDVALKVPHAGVMSEPKRVERFLREAKATAQLRHPHIVAVFDAGKDADRYYIASQFIEGQPLSDTIPETGTDFDRAARIVRELAEALAYAHEQGVVHRDVKPANVMLDAQERAHLMDFGLAARTDEETRITHDGAVMGTPSYMAPEQASGLKGDPKPSVDQYAAGVVLYELLTGRTPFEGPVPVVLHNVLHTVPDSPRKHRPDVPIDLETICLKAMAKRPEDRYANCQEFADDLRRWTAGEPVVARPMKTWERVTRWVRKEPKMVIAMLVIAALLGVIVAMATRSDRPPEVAHQPGETAPPEPKTPVTPKKDVDPPPPKKLDPDVPKKEPGPKAVPKAPDPAPGGPKFADLGVLAGNEPVGRLDSKNVAVLTRASDPGAKWVPLEAGGAKGTVRANEVVLALPGYKADVRLDSGVVVHLWANTPEQVSLPQPIMHTRVRFHPAAGGRDADLSIDAGRVYITPGKDNTRVRLRVGTEVWDLVLKEAKSEILVQANTAYVPGTPFARKGGEPARTEARLVVLQGTVDFNAPKRFKASPGLTAWKEITWDSKSVKLTEPADLVVEKRKELHPSRVLDLEGEYGKAIQRVLSAEAKEVAEKGVRMALKELISREPPVKFFERQRTPPEYVDAFYPVQLAAYSQAAIAEGDGAGEMLGDLIDMLRTRELTRFFARQAAVVALSEWIGRAPENTDVLMTALRDKDFLPEHAQLVAALLRGYGSPTQGGVDALDQLVGFLDHELVTVREAALGNLLAFFDPGAAARPGTLLVTDVALRKAPEGEIVYPRFLNTWKERAEELKREWAAKKP